MKKFYLTLSLSAAILAASSTAFAGFEQAWMDEHQTEAVRERILSCNNEGETTEKRRTILASLNIRDMIRFSAEYLAKRSPDAVRLRTQEDKATRAYNAEWRTSLRDRGHGGGSFPQEQRLMGIGRDLQSTIDAITEDLVSGRVQGTAPLSIIQHVLRDKYDQEAARTLADEVASHAGLEYSIRIPRKEERLETLEGILEEGIPLAVLRELLAAKQEELASS